MELRYKKEFLPMRKEQANLDKMVTQLPSQSEADVFKFVWPGEAWNDARGAYQVGSAREGTRSQGVVRESISPDRAMLRTYSVVVDLVKSGLGGVQSDSNQRLM
jgi:hypothetical protein